jgi:sialate O-acetylesterase
MNLKLADVFSDNMVLQSGRPVPIWGWAAPGAEVTVAFGGQMKTSKVDTHGSWRVTLDPMPASHESRDLVVQSSIGNQKSAIENVLVGEVWICSGQSNMELPVGQSNDAEQEIHAAHYPLIRLLTVPKLTADQPQTELGGAVWQGCSPSTIANFSAVGYFFGRELFRRLNVPIGLINSSWGGTVAEAWTSREALLAVPELREIIASYDNNSIPLNLENLKVAYDKQMGIIEARTRDTGNTGWAKGWADLPSPEGQWKDANLPWIWQRNEDLNFSGVLWFRKELELPAAWVGQDLRLAIGACDKSDTTYFNNTQVGSVTMQDRPDAWSLLREYTVPGRLVRPGRNVIAVRVHSNMHAGGMTGPAALMQLACPARPALPPISLSGRWRYMVEQNYGLVKVPQPPPGPDSPNFPGCLFNAMIAPLKPFALRGAIWYQGESNADRARQYRTLFPTLIGDWRRHWRQDDLQFLFVQLANYMATPQEPAESQWAELREAQTMALRLPNTGMAVTIDIGEAQDIHPRNKQEVGLRLALSALADVYKVPGVIGSGPLFYEVRREGSALRVIFKHTAGGLVCRGSELKGFAVAGADRKFVWAQARIERDTVLVWSPSVPEPTAVRYAWADNPIGNLYNAAGLPASPFRTDNE